jgi:hypothetical protein
MKFLCINKRTETDIMSRVEPIRGHLIIKEKDVYVFSNLENEKPTFVILISRGKQILIIQILQYCFSRSIINE